jgi:hypothetical protein
MSNNDINKDFQAYTEFKYPLNQSLNNSLIEDIVSNTPRKDFFFHLKPQMNMNNMLLNMNSIPHLLMSDLKSPNKFSSLSLKKKEDIFDPSLFINGYNSVNKNNNSEFEQEKINSNIYFNSKKKDNKKLVGKKRLFKYILSSDKKLKNEGNIFVNITQLCLHGYHLLNLQLIENAYELKNIILPKTLIKLLSKKYKYFNILQYNRNKSKDNDNKFDKINLTLIELKENNLDYYKGETNSMKIINNYCNDMNKAVESIKNNYTNKKKIIYITKNILLLELLIRDCNLFTNFLLKKYNQIYLSNNNNILINNDNYQRLIPSNQATPKFILIPPPKQSIPNINNINNKQYIHTLPENHNTTSKKNILWNTNIKPNNNNVNDNNTLFINKQKTLFRAKIPLMNTYKCDFCERIFKNGQALGGHISQSHPKQSNKYKQKIEIRNSRTDRRELLYEARRRLFNAYHIDLEYLLKNKRKNEIKMFIKVHKNEYKKELFLLKSNQRNGPYTNNNNNNNIKKDEEIYVKQIYNNNIDNNNNISLNEIEK